MFYIETLFIAKQNMDWFIFTIPSKIHANFQIKQFQKIESCTLKVWDPTIAGFKKKPIPMFLNITKVELVTRNVLWTQKIFQRSTIGPTNFMKVSSIALYAPNTLLKSTGSFYMPSSHYYVHIATEWHAVQLSSEAGISEVFQTDKSVIPLPENWIKHASFLICSKEKNLKDYFYWQNLRSHYEFIRRM